jgi:hypothetical protein
MISPLELRNAVIATRHDNQSINQSASQPVSLRCAVLRCAVARSATKVAFDLLRRHVTGQSTDMMHDVRLLITYRVNYLTHIPS